MTERVAPAIVREAGTTMGIHECTSGDNSNILIR
jgi:hypothetical protein